MTQSGHRQGSVLNITRAAAGLAVAKQTVANFIEKASRLYEQERRAASAASPLEMYVRRWVGWATAGLQDGCHCSDRFSNSKGSVSVSMCRRELMSEVHSLPRRENLPPMSQTHRLTHSAGLLLASLPTLNVCLPRVVLRTFVNTLAPFTSTLLGRTWLSFFWCLCCFSPSLLLPCRLIGPTEPVLPCIAH